MGIKESQAGKEIFKRNAGLGEGFLFSGEITGKKINGEELSRIQRKAVEYGRKKFEIHECKTDMQFKSLTDLQHNTRVIKSCFQKSNCLLLMMLLPAVDDAIDDGTIPTDEDAYCT